MRGIKRITFSVIFLLNGCTFCLCNKQQFYNEIKKKIEKRKTRKKFCEHVKLLVFREQRKYYIIGVKAPEAIF